HPFHGGADRKSDRDDPKGRGGVELDGGGTAAVAGRSLFRPGRDPGRGGTGMARPPAVLKALAKAYRRDWTALQSLTGNNFFLISLFLLRQSGTFVYLILGLVLLFPLSTDPLRKIPASRLALWPLTGQERGILRLAGPWINPLTWVLAGLAIWSAGRTMSFGLWGLL